MTGFRPVVRARDLGLIRDRELLQACPGWVSDRRRNETPITNWASVRRARVRLLVFGRTERPGHVVVLAQNARGHVGRAGAHRGELKDASGKLFQRDAAGSDFLDGAGDLIDGASEVSVIHPNDGLACLLDPVEDPLVFDLEFGVALCLLAYDLPEGVVLP